MLPGMETYYVDTPDKLRELCDRLSGSEWLALDTEFMRERTYYPQLCLLQVGTPEITAYIDPLALPDIEPILDLIYDPDRIKVMHAGGQDLEILYHLREELPTRIFDTQLAAPLLGHPEQAGYARLVEAILGKRLEKTHTRADWSHRPLSEAQLNYAGEDVIYLCQMYVTLRDELTRRDRLSWLDEDFAALSDATPFREAAPRAWRRVKGTYKLRGGALAVAQALAFWREQTAQREDRPRGWLLKDDELVDIARQRPGTREELGRIRGLKAGVLKSHGEDLLALIETAKTDTPEALPEYKKSLKLTPEQEAVTSLLSALVQKRAAEQALSPAQLAPPKELQGLVLGVEDGLLLKGWRRKLIGDELLSILRSEAQLGVVDGRLSIHPARD